MTLVDDHRFSFSDQSSDDYFRPAEIYNVPVPEPCLPAGKKTYIVVERSVAAVQVFDIRDAVLKRDHCSVAADG